MRISKLNLRGFRNISDLGLEFCPGLNVLIGRNAQGKTNIIEAIGLLSTATSFRTSEFRDMIGWDFSKAEVSAEVEAADGDDVLRVTMDASKKTFLRNGKRAMPRRSSPVKTVLFAPEEIMLLRNSPGSRRRYMDSFISQLHGPHRSDTSKYEKVLRQRNRILGDFDTPAGRRSTLVEPWDEQLCSLGARIVASRSEWMARLNGHIPEQYERIAPADGGASFDYAPHCGGESLGDGSEAIRRTLVRRIAERRKDELARGVTLVGPHRDDLRARIGEQAVKGFGSQGQHRSFVLALKLAEMRLVVEETGCDPILLLDDVASELDRDRNRQFFATIYSGPGQAFITATALEDVRMEGGTQHIVFDVNSGQAKPRK